MNHKGGINVWIYSFILINNGTVDNVLQGLKVKADSLMLTGDLNKITLQQTSAKPKPLVPLDQPLVRKNPRPQ